MRNTEQTSGQSILDHGQSVNDYFFDLLEHLRSGSPLEYEWKLPDWIYDPILIEDLPSDDTLSLYLTMHDCGKPFCLEIDEEGRRHFPGHAQKSAEVFVQFYSDPIAQELIRRDMEIHTLKSDGVQAFAKSPFATALLLAGLAELHSNARLFGGTDSTSFKIKYKSISQRGKQILQTIKTND